VAGVEFLGVGDATDFERGQTSIWYQGSCQLLVDCGPQIPLTVARRHPSPDELDGIYLTHLHADHCFGLPALLLWLRQQGRRRSLSLIGETEVLSAALQLVNQGYPDAFAPSKCFAIDPVPLTPSCRASWMQTVLSIAPTEHNVLNFALRVEDGKVAWAISGDGRCGPRAATLYHQLDLLIHECAFLDRQSASHTNADEVIELCRHVRPRQLALTHCSREDRSAIHAKVSTALGAASSMPMPGDHCAINAK
jgi:ribonuclease Z